MTPGPDDVDSAETAASHLYGLAAEDFVAARDQLVRSLRAAGRRDLAAEVKGLRRPSVVAAELNRALRLDPARGETLIEAAEALRAGHHQLLAGGTVDIAALTAAHRQAAATIAAGAGDHRDEVRAALESASLDQELRDRLRDAAFAREPRPARGFDLLDPQLLGAASAIGRARPPRSPEPQIADPVPIPAPDPATDPEPEPAPDPVRAEPEHQAVPEPELEAEPEPEPEPEPEREAEARAERRAERRAEQQAEARHLAISERAGAERRLAAARAGEARAAQRVAELTQRLDDARRHHDDTLARVAAAEAALEQADRRLRRFSS